MDECQVTKNRTSSRIFKRFEHFLGGQKGCVCWVMKIFYLGENCWVADSQWLIVFCHEEFQTFGLMRPYFSNWVHSCWAKIRSCGVIPVWVALVGLLSSFSLKGKDMKNFGFFHNGFGWVKMLWFSGQNLRIWFVMAWYEGGELAKE